MIHETHCAMPGPPEHGVCGQQHKQTSNSNGRRLHNSNTSTAAVHMPKQKLDVEVHNTSMAMQHGQVTSTVKHDSAAD